MEVKMEQEFDRGGWIIPKTTDSKDNYDQLKSESTLASGGAEEGYDNSSEITEQFKCPVMKCEEELVKDDVVFDDTGGGDGFQISVVERDTPEVEPVFSEEHEYPVETSNMKMILNDSESTPIVEKKLIVNLESTVSLKSSSLPRDCTATTGAKAGHHQKSVEDSPVKSSFKCKFCKRKLISRRGLRIHELRAHIKPWSTSKKTSDPISEPLLSSIKLSKKKHHNNSNNSNRIPVSVLTVNATDNKAVKSILGYKTAKLKLFRVDLTQQPREPHLPRQRQKITQLKTQCQKGGRELRAYKCTLCRPHSYVQNRHLSRHKVRHHVESLFAPSKSPNLTLNDFKLYCDYVLKVEELSWKMEGGANQKNENPNRKCLYCSTCFNNKYSIRAHIVSSHKDVISKKLTELQRSTSLDELKSNDLPTISAFDYRGQGQRWICDGCRATFAHRSGLLTHKRLKNCKKKGRIK